MSRQRCKERRGDEAMTEAPALSLVAEEGQEIGGFGGASGAVTVPSTAS
jgi:hypothetical protein